MSATVAVIEGDGIGPEVIGATTPLIRDLVPDLDLKFYPAGDGVYEETGTALPKETLNGALKADAVLMGATGETAAEVVIRLRQELDTYVNLRPVKSYSGVDCLYPDLDIIIARENTECLYAGIESEIVEGVTTATRVISEKASTRIAEFAFDYATREDYDKVTAIHKSNVLQVTDGLFLDAVGSVAERFEVPYEEMLVDAAALHLVQNPARFEVIVTPNLFGDILSDLGGGLVGGLGLCPSANIGEEHGIFEPVHGTAPDIAGTGKANPTATIVSASYLLRFLGKKKAGDQLEAAVEEALSKGETTPDLGGNLSTQEMSEAIRNRLN
mgnify:CR=1 FL=1